LAIGSNELKFDGYRALALKAGKEVRLVSRNQKTFNNDYPQLIDSLKLLTAKNVIIDGEITALDSEGRSSFQLLQSYGISKRIPFVYYVFDLLNLGGNRFARSTARRTTEAVRQALEESP
jgi:bifunctional non-homologous end joining protein LigD